MTSAEVVGSRQRRRERARLLVVLDGATDGACELARALRDAVRQEGSVLACAVVHPRADEVERELIRAELTAAVARAECATGVHGRTETALLDPTVFEALAATARGGTLVVVQEHRRAVLRSAPPRPPARLLARPA
ncbi:hypothetical protein [Modestobacter sp. NPDC049651]|uniref:hypothetical protein n=1 Tax=unclassified Modestobacter TaxID=2643866 RepID=UPI0033D00507